jgi:hypothetical protein
MHFKRLLKAAAYSRAHKTSGKQTAETVKARTFRNKTKAGFNRTLSG